MIDGKTFQYLLKYIKNKFAAHYEFLNKNMLKTDIINVVYKEYGQERICNGEADEFLNKIISDYLKDNYINDLNNKDDFKLHIRKVVTHKKTILSNEKQSKMLDSIIDKIAMDLDKERDYNVSLDEKIIKLFNNYLNIMINTLDDYVADVWRLSFIRNNSDNGTVLYLRKSVVKKLLEVVSIDYVLDGNYDEEIIKLIEEMTSYNKDKVRRYVQKYIRNLDYPFNISEKLIIADINKKIFTTGEFSLKDLYDGKLDNYIAKHGRELFEKQSSVDALNYIYNLISKDSELDKDELVEWSKDILNVLTEKNNCSITSILRGNHDEVILRIYNRFMMKRNSVATEQQPKQIKHDTKKKKISKVLKWLLVITVAASVTVGGLLIYNVVDYNIASYKVSKFDGYTYEEIYAADNNRVEPTGENAYEFYKKVASAGYDRELYGYLSFYKAYVLVHQDRLYIMDTIMKEAKYEASHYDDEISKEFYNELSSCSCFLELAMRQLEKSGYEEVTKTKYKQALSEYEQAMQGKEKPMDVVSLETKEAIQEIMKLYRKNSRDKINAFGDMLDFSVNMNDNMLLSSENHSRRNI